MAPGLRAPAPRARIDDPGHRGGDRGGRPAPPSGLVAPPGNGRPRGRPSRDRVRGPRAASCPARERAVRRPAAADLHRQGVRQRTGLPRARRADRRGRPGVAGTVPRLPDPPDHRARDGGAARLARALGGGPGPPPGHRAEAAGDLRRAALGAGRLRGQPGGAPAGPPAVAGGPRMIQHAAILPLPLPYPFDLAFMQRALFAGLVVGAFAPLIGTFLVQKRMSLIGDGIGHLAFAGVALGAVAGVYPLWTALGTAVAGALGVERLRARRKASGDLALALFFYSGIALGIVLLSRQLNPTNVLVYLFGQILTVTSSEVLVIVVLGVVVVAAILGVRRAMFAAVVDEEWARVAGLPVGVLASMRVVGILLVAGLMVLPVASAQMLARSFRATMLWAMSIGVGSVIVGLVASRLWDLASGGTIVLVAAATFAVVAVASGARSRTQRLRVMRSQAATDGLVPRRAAPILGDSHSE